LGIVIHTLRIAHTFDLSRPLTNVNRLQPRITAFDCSVESTLSAQACLLLLVFPLLYDSSLLAVSRGLWHLSKCASTWVANIGCNISFSSSAAQKEARLFIFLNREKSKTKKNWG
jgi:hypothetical protein